MNRAQAAKILGVSEYANADEIKKAYRREAMKFHPDRNKNDPLAEDKFKDVQAAKDFFDNTSKFQNRKSENSGDDSWRDLFNIYMRNNYKSSKNSFNDFEKPQSNREYSISITLQQAFAGGNTNANIKMVDGKIETVYMTFKEGVNNGEIIHSFSKNDVMYVFKAAINPEDSRGNKYTFDYAESPFESNSQIIKHGDIYRDFYCPVVTMIIGGFVDVFTLDGATVRVRIPEGLEAGMKVKLRGKGFWKSDIKLGRGDCYLKIIPEIKTFPKMSTEELNKLVDAAKTEQIIRNAQNP